ncbi:MAG TPA: DUF1552 domain-containing protein [Polyangiaceae bacterium]|nr:DUF1552 domain-containing protein [Polyangiaceae bacterium]
MKSWHVNRRTFLRGGGGVAIGLPLLNAMFPSRAAAQAAKPIRRFLLWSENNGMVMNAWRPSGGLTDFKLGKLHGSLEPYRKYLLILSGLHNKGSRDNTTNGGVHQGNAGIATGGTNSRGGIWSTEQGVLAPGTGITNPTFYSVDQRICQEPDYRGALAAKFPSYQFGVQVSDIPATSARLNYKYTLTPTFVKDTSDNNKLIPQYEGMHVESNPQQAFKDLFGAPPTGQPMSGGTGTAEEQAAAALRRSKKRGSVLDYVQESYAGIMRKLGTEDQRRLSEHRELIRKLEQQVAVIPPSIANSASCKPPSGAGLPSGRPCKEEEQGTNKGVKNINGCTGDLFEPIGKAQIDLLTMALSCDLIRVGTMQWSMAGNRVGFGHIGAGGATHHDLAHARDPKLEIIHTWYASMMAYMLGKLTSVVEPDGSTLLDKTGILWTNELSVGATHSQEDIPLMLIGGAAGALHPGRYLDFRGKDRSNSDLLLSILHAYGIMEQRFGDIRGEAKGWFQGALDLG